MIKRICMQSDLRTFDPYDIWKTNLGFRVKDLYNRNRLAGLPPAALLTLFDTFINNRLRLFYEQQEYPIVRALAAQTLLNVFARNGDESVLVAVREHLQWLQENSCTGYSGPCWGLGFHYAVDKSLVYDANTPLTTMTPYALEAFVDYTRLNNDSRWLGTILGIYEFLERDIPVLEETDDYAVTAYSNLRDRKVINAVSYVMFAYSLLHAHVDETQRNRVAHKIRKLYNFVRRSQALDGSWPYSPDQTSFIDCFHSCIVIKNIIKTAKVIELEDWQGVTTRGYRFLKEQMLVPEKGLFKRFARTNKPGIIRFDLYDNAEMLNLAALMGDSDLVHSLDRNIDRTFVDGERIFSHVDFAGIRHGSNMLRWAVMPYLYALSVSANGAER